MSRVTAILGGGFGSEGKGVIVSHIANEYDIHIRVGSPNAGHSHKVDGKTWVNQIIPVGWVNREATLIIGRGALVNPRILRKEIEDIEKADPDIRKRLWVDARAGVLSPWHEEAEGHTEGELHQRIGSTGEGVGAARISRLRREPKEFKLFEQVAEENGLSDLVMADTVHFLNVMRKNGSNILMEGSQGSGLGLIHGTWPYCTTTECGSAQLCSDIGIPPQAVTDTILVVRTYPIRVAGNSGPLQNELSWEELSQRVGKHIEPERTTVTKKIRRIGEWDWRLLDQAVWLNEPNHIALTFTDYLHPGAEGVTEWDQLPPHIQDFVFNIEAAYAEVETSDPNDPFSEITYKPGPRVSFIGTGLNKNTGEWTVVDRRS